MCSKVSKAIELLVSPIPDAVRTVKTLSSERMGLECKLRLLPFPRLRLASGSSLPSPLSEMTSDHRPTPGEVTRLLFEARGGDDKALEKVLPLIYDELRRLAQRQVQREAQGHTLHATELVHEAYLKLSGGGGPNAKNRPHLMAMASRAMRQLLVDHARSRKAKKRGGDWQRTTFVDGPSIRELAPEDLLTLEGALAELDPRQRQVVECRFFGGMEESEIALALSVSERTVRRDWVKARAWLYSRLYPEDSGETPSPARP
jgi:RNA polymerase sigma factor (TIGR02999 family)